MRRNAIRKAEKRTERRTEVAVKSAGQVTKGLSSAGQGRKAGGNDAGTGEWVAYGWVGVTPVGAPFRVRGD